MNLAPIILTDQKVTITCLYSLTERMSKLVLPNEKLQCCKTELNYQMLYKFLQWHYARVSHSMFKTVII